LIYYLENKISSTPEKSTTCKKMVVAKKITIGKDKKLQQTIYMIVLNILI